MAPLTLQEVIDRVNANYNHYSTKKVPTDQAESRPHHPEYYVPRITRLFAGLMFGAFRTAGQITTTSKSNSPYSAASQELVPLVAKEA